MVFADLPYGTTNHNWDCSVDLEQFWKTLQVIRTGNGIALLTATHPFASDLICSNRKEFKYDLVWHKSRASGHLNAKRMPLRTHELALAFYKKLPTYNPIKSPRWTKRVSTFIKNDTSSSKIYGSHQAQSYVDDGMRYPVSVIYTNSQQTSGLSVHPTQKPVALLEWLIKTYTNPGDTVLDPTFGSCTTGVACARLGRNFIGIEKDPGYFRTGRERVDAERAKLGLQPCEVNS